ncbi:hypothetical protein BS47DRAFT_1400070 [Hydnum rufescens UP504]|uniref:Uncharacterized protein n=1 Tax=Hydnum rufescens UP504 TaxID=1448309 RepID=A0A9P6DLG6_9AGAM|nr:hypothetical protein BS47DRAFT_1400070 [Hydnum rufescens UP504]
MDSVDHYPLGISGNTSHSPVDLEFEWAHSETEAIEESPSMYLFRQRFPPHEDIVRYEPLFPNLQTSCLRDRQFWLQREQSTIRPSRNNRLTVQRGVTGPAPKKAGITTVDQHDRSPRDGTCSRVTLAKPYRQRLSTERAYQFREEGLPLVVENHPAHTSENCIRSHLPTQETSLT